MTISRLQLRGASAIWIVCGVLASVHVTHRYWEELAEADISTVLSLVFTSTITASSAALFRGFRWARVPMLVCMFCTLVMLLDWLIFFLVKSPRPVVVAGLACGSIFTGYTAILVLYSSQRSDK